MPRSNRGDDDDDIPDYDGVVVCFDDHDDNDNDPMLMSSRSENKDSMVISSRFKYKDFMVKSSRSE